MNLQNSFHPVPKPQKKRKPSKARAKEFTLDTKEAVRERSKGMCEICKQRAGVHFHHVIYRSHINGEAARDISNCLLLCLPCHETVHAAKAMREYAEHLSKELAGKA